MRCERGTTIADQSQYLPGTSICSVYVFARYKFFIHHNMCSMYVKRQLHALEEEVRDLRDTKQVMFELLQSSRELKEQVKDIKATQEP